MQPVNAKVEDRAVQSSGQEKTIPSSLSSTEQRRDIALALGLAAVIILSVMVWSLFDYRFPTQDEAAHIMGSIRFKELLMHCRPWQYQWWLQCFSASPFYPPFAYLVGGAFLVTLGQSRLVEHAYMAFFAGLMVVSVWGLTRQLSGGRVAACAAVLFLSAYPVISWLSHIFFLDMPSVAMAAFALMTLLWWRQTNSPDLVRTFLCGVVLGAGCLTKQSVAGFLLPVGLYFAARDLIPLLFRPKEASTRGHIAWLMHTVLVGVITFLVGLPFIAVNYEWNVRRAQGNMQALASWGTHTSGVEGFTSYCSQIPIAMSPILLGVFIVSLLFVRPKDYKRLLPLVLSTVGGICLLSVLPNELQDERYLAPFLILPAIFSGFMVESLIRSGNALKRSAGIALIALAASMFFAYSFVPYPVALPKLPAPLNWGSHDGNPTPRIDWGHTLALETISKIDKDKVVYLNILPNHETLSINVFRLLLLEQGNAYIRVSGSRDWTIVGDRVKFDPKIAQCFHWYLLKTGASGFRFYDERSKEEYAKLVDFVCHGGFYMLVTHKPLPDGSELMLYRRIF